MSVRWGTVCPRRTAIQLVTLVRARDHSTTIPGFLDALHLAHERGGVSGSAFHLLRPDTYVGSRGAISQGESLLDYLRGVLA